MPVFLRYERDARGIAAELSTHEEIIRFRFEDGIAITTVTTGCARVTLERLGFRLVETVAEHDLPAPRDENNPLRVARAPRGEARRKVADHMIQAIEEAGATVVVFVVTGWGDLEAAAVARAVDIAKELDGLGVIVVQNDPTAPKVKVPGAKVVRRSGFSFAAACHAGFLEAIKLGARWVLFTQSDVTWGTRDLLLAVAASLAEVGGRWDLPAPIVGVSGGMVDGWPAIASIGIREIGRNARQLETLEVTRTIPVDWLAGYWIVARVEDVVRAGGWDPGYRLYWEDVDFSFRLAAVGSRPLIQPGLAVDHARGSTIRRLLTDEQREEIRRTSFERFVDLWMDRCVGT